MRNLVLVIPLHCFSSSSDGSYPFSHGSVVSEKIKDAIFESYSPDRNSKKVRNL